MARLRLPMRTFCSLVLATLVLFLLVTTPSVLRAQPGGQQPATPAADADGWRTYADTDPLLGYSGQWSAFQVAKAFGGTLTGSDDADASLTVHFEGTGIRVLYAKGPEGGDFTGQIDEFWRVYGDALADSYSYGHVMAFEDIEPGTHTLRVVNGKGAIWIEGIQIQGTLLGASMIVTVPTPTPGPTPGPGVEIVVPLAPLEASVEEEFTETAATTAELSDAINAANSRPDSVTTVYLTGELPYVVNETLPVLEHIIIQGTVPITLYTLASDGNVIQGNGVVPIFDNDDHLELRHVRVSNGHSNYYGGLLYNSGTLEIYDSVIEGHTAEYGGGAISNYLGTITLDRVAIRNNTGGGGGAVHMHGGTAMINCTFFEDNSAGYGGGLLNAGDSYATIQNSKFEGNVATGDPPEELGGDIYNLMGTVNAATHNEWVDGPKVNNDPGADPVILGDPETFQATGICAAHPPQQPPQDDVCTGVTNVDEKSGTVAVRLGPGTEYDQLTRLEDGVPLTVLESVQGGSFDWYRVQNTERIPGNGEGWIYTGAVDLSDSPVCFALSEPDEQPEYDFLLPEPPSTWPVEEAWPVGYCTDAGTDLNRQRCSKVVYHAFYYAFEEFRGRAPYMSELLSAVHRGENGLVESSSVPGINLRAGISASDVAREALRANYWGVVYTLRPGCYDDPQCQTELSADEITDRYLYQVQSFYQLANRGEPNAVEIQTKLVKAIPQYIDVGIEALEQKWANDSSIPSNWGTYGWGRPAYNGILAQQYAGLLVYCHTTRIYRDNDGDLETASRDDPDPRKWDSWSDYRVVIVTDLGTPQTSVYDYSCGTPSWVNNSNERAAVINLNGLQFQVCAPTTDYGSPPCTDN